MRFSQRRADAVSTALIAPGRCGLSIRLDYLWIESGAGLTDRLADLFGLRRPLETLAIGAVTFSFAEAGRLSSIALDVPLSSWRHEPLANIPPGLEPIYMRPVAASSAAVQTTAAVEVVWDREAAQLAIRVAPARRWRAIADNLAIGDDGYGAFCELRVFGFPDEPEIENAWNP